MTRLPPPLRVISSLLSSSRLILAETGCSFLEGSGVSKPSWTQWNRHETETQGMCFPAQVIMDSFRFPLKMKGDYLTMPAQHMLTGTAFGQIKALVLFSPEPIT